MHDTYSRRIGTLSWLTPELARFGSRPAVLSAQADGLHRLSFSGLAEQAASLSSGLSQGKARAGDRVALLAENSPQWIVACLGVLRAGGIVVPVDIQTEDGPLARILEDSGAQLVFTQSDQHERLTRLAPDAEQLLLDVDEVDPRSWQHLLSEQASEPPERDPEDIAILFYTSGTTGQAKGVPLSHRNLLFQIDTIAASGLVGEGDRALLPLPLHHVYPLVIGTLVPLALGLPVILPRAMSGPEILRAAQLGEATIMVGVPRLYRALYDAIQGRAESSSRLAHTAFHGALGLSRGLSRIGMHAGRRLFRPLHQRMGPDLQRLASGGAALPADLGQRLQALGWEIATGYGLTETAPLLTVNLPGEARLASAGRPVEGVEIQIDTEAWPGDAPPRPGAGEVLARGPNVFTGYWNLPEKTAEAFTQEGWYRTGDLGYLDDDGYLYLLGRRSTLIVTEAGENIQPEAVEAIYDGMAEIQETGVLDDHGRLAAVIIPDVGEIHRLGHSSIEAAVRNAVERAADQLPSYQRISDYVIAREPLARTRLGKLRRHLLAQRYAQAHTGEEAAEGRQGPMPIEAMAAEDRALLQQEQARAVWDWLAQRYPGERLTPDTSPQLDLGVDSMEWVNLSLTLSERWGIVLPDDAVARITSVRDLLQEVAAAAGESAAEQPGYWLHDPESLIPADERHWLDPLSPTAKRASRGLHRLDRWLIRRPFDLRVEHYDRLPVGRQYVLAPNHVSYLDPFCLAAALEPEEVARTYWGGARIHAFARPWQRAVSRLARVVPIEPERSAVSSLGFGAAILRRGYNLVWFPEGQRSPTGELQPFRTGLGVLLSHYPVVVVPVYIQGTRDALPRGHHLPRLRPVTVRFGEPLDPRELAQHGQGDEPAERLVNALREHVRALGEEVQQDHGD